MRRGLGESQYAGIQRSLPLLGALVLAAVGLGVYNKLADRR